MFQFRSFFKCLVLLSAAFFASSDLRAESIHGLDLKWVDLPPLPDATGVAGAFAGVVDDYLLVMGGANFPEAAPWDQGTKVWSDKVYALDLSQVSAEPGSNKNVTWTLLESTLPGSRAYGVTVSTDDGVILAGGGDAESHSDEVWRVIVVDQEMSSGREMPVLKWEALPNLPAPVAFQSGALVGEILYVAGGITEPGSVAAEETFWALDLADVESGWRDLPTWPGQGRMLAVAASALDSFYLVSGVALGAGPDGGPQRTYLTDAFSYQAARGWKKIAEIPEPVAAAPSPAFTAGDSHFWILGGDSGKGLANPPPSLAEHPGFSRSIYSYHAITDVWSEVGAIPDKAPLEEEGTQSQPGAETDTDTDSDTDQFLNAAPTPQRHWPTVTATGVPYNGAYLIPSGEIRPGIRSPSVRSLRLVSNPPAFHWLNATVLTLYLGITLAAGFYWARRNNNTDDYFRGGQKIPWWVAGLSIYATMLSSLTYMGVPAKAYATNWEYLLGYPFIFIASAMVVKWVLPFFRSIDATSAYEYLEIRFNKTIRRLGSALFIFFQIGRMAVVLYLSALALNVMTPLTVTQCILLMGGLSLVYSAIGGVEAVAWTDAIQSIVLLLGAFLSVGWILSHVDGGLGEVWSVAVADQKTEWLRWEWGAGSWSAGVFWVIALGGLAQNMVSYSSDQAVVQRYMTTSDEKRAARSIWTNACMALPTGALFFFLGACLYVFYKSHPASLDPTFKTDAVLPLFIARELPVGLSGLVIAGVFAAAQSTISTSMNSIATAVVTDFIRPFKSSWTDQALLKSARNVTILAGLVGISLGILFGLGNIQSALDQFFAILGLFGGPLGGVFLLGMCSRRANSAGALTGMCIGALATYWAQNYSDIHVYLHAFIGLSVCMGLGRVVSGFFPPDSDSNKMKSTAHQ